MKIERVIPKNEMHPDMMSICINLNAFPWSVSASRQYMLGNNVGKAVPVSGATTRKITSGFESHYGATARKIVAPSNMIVEKVFYRGSNQDNGQLSDDWSEIYVVFFNEELQKYDLLVLPKYNTQNSYVAFEYVYDKDLMRKLGSEEKPTFPKGAVFAKSPSISETGEWMFGLEANVCGLTAPYTEEDGIAVTDRFIERIATTFEHKRKFAYNESEYVALNLYGTPDNPRAFPENGEPVRDDGIVMGFRRRDTSSALVGLTRKALMNPQDNYDILFYAPPNSVVKSVHVTTERFKNRAHNKSAFKATHPHTESLDRFAELSNRMANEVKEWNRKLEAKYRDSRLPVTPRLLNFIWKQLGEVVKDHTTGRYNLVKNTHRNKNKLDWNITITLKERVRGKKRFKLTDVNGGKGVIVKVIPWQNAPRYADGRIADVIINNTPAFRRQIFSALIEPAVNLVNYEVHSRVKRLVNEANGYALAFAELMKFYRAIAPEFAELVETATPTEEEQFDHVDYILREDISVQIRSDTTLYGVEIVRSIMKNYPEVKPQHATYINDLGQEVTTLNPVIISSMYYMLLDKFGTDMSAQSMPKRNLFGRPAKLNHNDRYRSWHRDQAGRNGGEAEARGKAAALGGEEFIREMIAATSPVVATRMAQRIIRANQPFRIKELVRLDELNMNRALHMAMNMVRDAGYDLRKETADDIAS